MTSHVGRVQIKTWPSRLYDIGFDSSANQNNKIICMVMSKQPEADIGTPCLEKEFAIDAF